MVKVKVCDVCMHAGKLTKAIGAFRIKGKPWLKLDYCDRCKDMIPDKVDAYIAYAENLRRINDRGT